VRNMKYIIVDNGMNDIPFIFPDSIEHKAFFEMLGRGTIVAAGFVTFSWDGGLSCYGNSASLGVSSREIDSTIINKTLGYKGD